jgi:hypothetical protein
MPIAVDPHRRRETLSRRHIFLGAAAGWAMTIASPSVLAQGVTSLGRRPTDQLTAQAFEPYLNRGFLVSGDGVTTSLKLISIKTYARGRRPNTFRDPFSLLFRASPGEVLPAGIYQVQDPAGHTIAMALNQVSMNRSIYEASFS